MPEKVKTVLIGCFIIIACLAILGVLLFLRPTVGDGKKKIFVCFTSIEKIQIGTRVTFAGKPVGEVVAIREMYDARSQPTGRYGHICFYELELAIDSKTVVYDTDEIALHTTGLMGEKTIAIIPKAVPKGTPSYPVTDQIMYGKSGDPVEETLNQIITLGQKASGVIDQIQGILTQNKEPIHDTILSIKDAAAAVSTSFTEINNTKMIDNISSTFANFSAISKEWDEQKLGETLPTISRNLASITDALNKPEVLEQTLDNLHTFTTTLADKKDDIGALIDNLRHASDRLSTFSDSLNPEGSIAKLFQDDTVYLQFVQLMSKANVLMDDVNNYGILFHLDKGWQRERVRRMNLLAKLSTARDFACYFDDELGQINISLCRIAKAIDKAQKNRNCYGVVQDKEFNCQYSELLGRLQEVEESLEVYRQQLIECGKQQRCRR